MKDYVDMNLQELQEAYMKELDEHVDQIPKSEKARWLLSIANTENPDPIKVRTMRGYLIGLRDCGKNIGDLKFILEQISIEIE